MGSTGLMEMLPIMQAKGRLTGLSVIEFVEGRTKA